MNQADEPPAGAAVVLSRMFQDRWLHHYRDAAGIRQSINRIAVRRPIASKMLGGERVIEAQLPQFIQIFREFYPQLLRHMQKHREQWPASSRLG